VLPAAPLALRLDRREVVRVDLRDHQRDIRIHAMVARVGEDALALGGEARLDLASDASRQSRENDRAAHRLLIVLHPHLGRLPWRRIAEAPVADFPVTLAC